MKKNIKSILNKTLQPHSRLHNILKVSLSYVGLARRRVFTDKDYRTWISVNESRLSPVISVENNIYVSIIICCWNTPDKYLKSLIFSLTQQRLKLGWEAILVDVSSDIDRSRAIKQLCEQQQNFVYVKAENRDISSNTNIGVLNAQGDYIAFVDHDDTISTEAMNEVITAIIRDEPDIIYSDEDKINDRGDVRHSPYFKPDWSPEVILYTNYLNHLTIIKKRHVDAVGGLRPELNGSQDYDLLLRVVAALKKPNIVHIPKILYHWREADGSTAQSHNNKAYAFVAGKQALENYFKIQNITAKVDHIDNSPGFYKEVFEVPKKTRVLICVNEKDGANIETIKKSTDTELDIYYEPHSLDDIDFVVQINKNVKPLNTSWLDEIIGVFQLPNIQAVSPRILSSNHKVVHDAGLAYIPAISEFREYRGLREDEYTPTGGVRAVRNVSVLPEPVIVSRVNDSKDISKLKVVWSHVDFIDLD